MLDTQPIQVEKTTESKISKVDFSDIQFGKIYSDHQFSISYDGEN